MVAQGRVGDSRDVCEAVDASYDDGAPLAGARPRIRARLPRRCRPSRCAGCTAAILGSRAQVTRVLRGSPEGAAVHVRGIYHELSDVDARGRGVGRN